MFIYRHQSAHAGALACVLMAASALSMSGASAQQQDAESVQTIVVTGTRTERLNQDIPVSIAVQDMETRMENGFTYGTDEFRGVPGVSFRRGEGGGDAFPFVSFRGSPGTDGYLALIDGIPFVGVFEEAPLDQIPYSVVDRVEVVKGPGSTLYGRGAVYGVSNYITKSPDENRSQLIVTGGSNGYLRAQGTVTRELENGSGILIDYTSEDYEGWRENGSHDKQNIFVKWSLPISSRTDISAYLNYYEAEKDITNGLPLDNNGNVLPVAGGRKAFLGYGEPQDEQEVIVGVLRAEHDFTPELSLSSSLQFRRTDRDNTLNFYDPFGFAPDRNVYAVNGFRSEKSQDAFIFDSSISWNSGRHSMVAGLSADHATSDALDMWSGQNGFSAACGFSFFLIEVDYSTGNVINRDHPCFAVDLPYSHNEVENTAWGVFVQDEIALSGQWFLTLGVRYDAFERVADFEPVAGNTASGKLSGDTDAFSPRVALSWRNDLGNAYLSYGRGFNSNFGPIFEWNPANYARPVNKPTTIDSLELGWKATALDNRFSYEVAVFHSEQSDRRSTIPNPAAEIDFSQPGNLITYGQQYVSEGIELSLSYSPTTDARLSLAASRINPKWDEYIINSYGSEIDLSGTTPVGVAENTFYAAYEHRFLPWLEMRATYEYYGDYQITQDNRVSGGDYDLLTLGASVYPGWWPSAVMKVSAINALDEEYYFYFGGRNAPTYATPGTEREIRASLEVSW